MAAQVDRVNMRFSFFGGPNYDFQMPLFPHFQFQSAYWPFSVFLLFPIYNSLWILLFFNPKKSLQNLEVLLLTATIQCFHVSNLQSIKYSWSNEWIVYPFFKFQNGHTQNHKETSQTPKQSLQFSPTVWPFCWRETVL